MFSEKITGPWNIYVYGLLGYENFFEKLVKHSGFKMLQMLVNILLVHISSIRNVGMTTFWAQKTILKKSISFFEVCTIIWLFNN